MRAVRRKIEKNGMIQSYVIVIHVLTNYSFREAAFCILTFHGDRILLKYSSISMIVVSFVLFSFLADNVPTAKTTESIMDCGF